MNIWENAVITQKGLALQAKLIAGNTLAITKVQIGAGYVTPGLLMQQTAVTDAKETMTQVASITYPEQGKCAVKINYTNDSVTTGYTARQVGFYATDPDEGEILYFIAQAESGQGTVVPSITEMPGYSAEWTFYFQYGQADNVNVTVDPSNTVSQGEMESYIKQYVEENTISEEEVITIVSEGYVKKTGDTMTGPLYINGDIVLAGLKDNVTLYVATTGSDSTGDGTSGKPFLTIAKALSVLPKNLNGKTATITVAAGTYNEARVDVTSFSGGELVITGTSSSAKPSITNGIYVNKCNAAVTLKWLTLTSSSSGSQGAAFVNCQQANIDTCAVTSATTQQNHGILIDSLSTAYIVGTHVTNCNYAVLSRAARVFIQSISGGGNRIGFYSTNGGDIRIRESTVASTGALYFTEYGGRIYMGGQVSAPNY